MTVFVSEKLNLGYQLKELNVFDSLMDEDSNFFINIKRLQTTRVEEFKDSYEKINNYFRGIGTLLKASQDIDDKMYKTAVKRFDFSEVGGINLGFSKGKNGAGFGPQLSEQVIKDASEIIKSGCDYPEIFHLTSLFEDNIGPDRLSDMVATLIYDDIVNYTLNKYKELGINEENYPNYQFNSDSGLLINPYKQCELLLLPIDILHELPIAIDWDDIDRVVTENNSIKSEINQLVGNEWKKLATSKKKHYIKEYIFKNPSIMEKVIGDYRETTVNPYDLNDNLDYYARRIFKGQISKGIQFAKKTGESNSLDVSIEIINILKQWVEFQKGYSIINSYDSKKREALIQKLFQLSANKVCQIFNFDISPEPDQGRGPVDFKISKGNDKTVIEIKITSNNNTVHGFDTQIEEYATAEGTQNKVFLLVDNGESSYRVKEVRESYEKRKANGENPAHIIVIDARPKKSASNY